MYQLIVNNLFFARSKDLGMIKRLKKELDNKFDYHTSIHKIKG